MKKRTALVAGATGLVGRHVVKILLSNPEYGRIITFGRRNPDTKHPKLQPLTGSFNKPGEVLKDFEINDYFCCLGTTIKKAGSRPAFFKVDYEYVVSLAEYGLDTGADQFILVSSIGANSKSTNFYIRVKGEVENKLKVFDYRGMHILRPSLLTGERDESRSGEKMAEALMKVLKPVMIGPLAKYRPIDAETVAAAMVTIAVSDVPGVFTYESDEVEAIGRRYLERNSG